MPRNDKHLEECKLREKCTLNGVEKLKIIELKSGHRHGSVDIVRKLEGLK